MSREEIQKLLGGYATDTLSEAEQRALFEAALEDQELFDALAKEQALRDVLRDRSARQQLIEALGPEREPFGTRVWDWLRRPAVLSLAGGMAVLLMVAGLVLRQTRHAARQEEMVADAIAPTPPAPVPPSATPLDAQMQKMEPRPAELKAKKLAPPRASRALAAPEAQGAPAEPVKKMEAGSAGQRPMQPAPLAVSPATPASEAQSVRGSLGGGGGGAAPPPAPSAASPPPSAASPPPSAVGVGGFGRGAAADTAEAKSQLLPAPQAPAVQNRVAREKAPLGLMRGAKAAGAVAAGRAVAYTLLMKGADDIYSPVPFGTAFHAGDSVRLRVEASEDGFVSLFRRGASGGWDAIARQAVEKGQRYELPSTGGLESDVPARVEVLLVLSRGEHVDENALTAPGRATATVVVEYR